MTNAEMAETDGGRRLPPATSSAQANRQNTPHIRSFVRRAGRMTAGQRHNLERLWPTYGLSTDAGPLDWQAIFGRNSPRTLEIGFGAGELLAQLAHTHPDEDFIGIEVYRNGVGRLLGKAERMDIGNLRVLSEDAVDILARAVPAASLDNLLLYFPDPWPKKRHHKRRLVQTGFADLVATVLKPGGTWRLATDWDNYADWMRAVLDNHPAFTNGGDCSGFDSAPLRPQTRFEARGLRKGHVIRDLVYRRN